ncbi:asparagine synthase-related protein [Zooshikella harenae]|uniref:asparagine synthase (glutamine-hydrolyzing) n=1 Tax=Zooshikella harenae TaxID=2827238 RepID=A0ABS5ZCF2_9GAMM|nr:asparagine synthase-related protein [Zooshikella harenae]MBU2711438.1 asparagine synthetase B [Zooshikella harenae]
MCGFLGYVGKLTPSSDIITKALSYIAYRGDIYGAIHQPSVHIWCTRLARTGNLERPQPVVNQKTRAITCLNGELYNIHQLINKTQSTLVHYRDISDTEYLSLLLSHPSAATSLSQLQGEFSFCHWNQAKQQLWLARDSFGSKPLFYKILENSIIFGSSDKAVAVLTEQHEQSSSINITAAQTFLVYGITPEETLEKNIFPVPAGQTIEFNYFTTNQSITKHILFESNSLDLTEPKKTNEKSVINTLHTSVHKRIIPQKTWVAASGGVDSSIIHHLAMSIDNSIPGYCAVWHRDKPLQLHSNVIPVLISPESLQQNINHFLMLSNRPITSLSGLAIYLTALHAKKDGFDTVLSGEGADEIFWGYPHYFVSSKSHPFFIQRQKDLKFISEIAGIDILTNVNSTAFSTSTQSPNPFDWNKIDFKYRLPGHLCRMNNDLPYLMASIESRLPYIDCLQYFSAKRPLTNKKVLFDYFYQISGLKPTKHGICFGCQLLGIKWFKQQIEQINYATAAELLQITNPKKLLHTLVSNWALLEELSLGNYYTHEIIARFLMGIICFCKLPDIFLAINDLNTFWREQFTTISEQEAMLCDSHTDVTITQC